MRVIWVAASLVVVMLAGCAEVPAEEEETHSEPVVEEVIEAFNGTLSIGLDNTTFGAGMPFNVTLDFAGDADPANMTWMLTFYNGTLPIVAADNAPADEGGNATADGNATANQTVGPSLDDFESVQYTGVGLPAVVSVNLTYIGNVTIAGLAEHGNDTVELMPIIVELISLGPSDPCAGMPVQEPIVIEDLYVGVAVDGTGLYQGHTFPLEDCQTKILAKITASEAYLDPMLRLKDNTGATVDAEDNEFLYTDTLTYEPGGYLAAGTWQIDARGYAAAPGNYKIELTFG